MCLIKYFLSVFHKNIGNDILYGLFEKFKQNMNAINETNPIVFKQDETFLSALHLSADMGRLEFIEYLAEKNQNINPHDNTGFTPMHYAAKNNRLHIIDYYLKSSAVIIKNPSQVSNDSFQGRTPLHIASEKGFLRMVKAITPYIEEKNPPDTYMFTPLHLATIFDQMSIVEYLVKETNDTNPHASIYWQYATPLSKATQYDNGDIVRYLVDLDPDRVDEKTQPGFFGQTAYEVSLKEGDLAWDVKNFLSQFERKNIDVTNEGHCENSKYLNCTHGDIHKLQL